MKKRSFYRLWVWSWVGLIGMAISSVAAEKEVTVTMSDEASSINGAEFFLAPQVSQLVSLWGNPDRESNLQNTVRIWDKLGVRSYSAHGKSSADSLSFTMKLNDKKLSSKEVFTGTIKIPGGQITSQSTVEDLKALGFKQHVLDKFYKLALLTGSFLAEIDTESGELVEVSVEFGF